MREKSRFSWMLAFWVAQASLSPANNGFCQDQYVPGEFFHDTFDDGDHEDAQPATWAQVGGFDAADARVVNGDLQIQGIFDVVSLAPIEPGSLRYWSYDNFSLTTQVRILSTSDVGTGIGLYGRRNDVGAYFGIMDNNGLLYLGETADGMVQNARTHPTSLRPTTEDIRLRMDFQADVISLTAWKSDDLMPAIPQLTLRDSTLASGAIAMLADGSGDATFRWFEVAPVPEPSGFIMLSWGMLLFSSRCLRASGSL